MSETAYANELTRDFWNDDPPTLPLTIRQTAVYKCLDDAEGRAIAFCSLQSPERDLRWAEFLRDQVNASGLLVEALRGLRRVNHHCWCETWVGGEHGSECVAASAALKAARVEEK
jgi:hypothetical protein